ncbi:MAG TPA: DUF4382 domain-containing protein [Phycisphaerae bacterium]|nr:DUF4382 domain-containing protein [Phycisphaerae bacterium]HRR86820.1 DUF4382 domain-containing protein [Phycisphaerae bacterium]
MHTFAKRIGIGACSSVCVLAITLGLLLGGSSVGRGFAPRPHRETGTLRVLVKNSPCLAERVGTTRLTVSRIEVRHADNHDAWVVIRDGEQVIDLLQTNEGRPCVLASADLAPGRYSQVRLICPEESIAVKDGHTPDWKKARSRNTPYGTQTAIHLNCDFAVSADDQTAILIDTGLEDALRMIAQDRRTDVEQVAGFRTAPPASPTD